MLARREGVAPAALQGLVAGAMGLPQFMPGSVNRYAVDFDGDGHIDLHGSAADVIGSVAHYLAEHGWQRGLPTHYEVTPPADARRTRAAAGARHRAQLQRRADGRRRRRAADAGARPRRPAGAGDAARTAPLRRATSPAPRTSTRSRATTGRATTRWR